MILPQRRENTQLKKYTLTIDGKEFSAIMEEHQIVEYGFDENIKVIESERIYRKYYLDEALLSFGSVFFEVIQDGVHRRKCYMSCDGMCLIEC